MHVGCSTCKISLLHLWRTLGAAHRQGGLLRIVAGDSVISPAGLQSWALLPWMAG